jgi:hypothetical protein
MGRISLVGVQESREGIMGFFIVLWITLWIINSTFGKH